MNFVKTNRCDAGADAMRREVPAYAAYLPSTSRLDIMSILEATATTIGEIAAYFVGRIAGKTFHLAPKTAQSVGEYVVFGVVVGAITIVGVIYS